MLKIVFVMALFAATSFGNASPRFGTARNGKIRNGVRDTIEQHPWQVSLGRLYPRGRIVFSGCGGSLISYDWVLTAGHCIEDTNRIRKDITHVFAGIDSISNRHRIVASPVDHTVVHKDFTHIGKICKNDIALLHVSVPFQFNDIVKSIQLYNGPSESIPGKRVTVSGFGRLEYNRTTLNLHSVVLDTVGQASCDELVSTDFRERVQHQNVFCARGAGNKGACPGDSGGPVTIKESSQTYLVGIVSYGSSICGNGESIFVNVPSYYTWILRQQLLYYDNRLNSYNK